jgi:hypothetical protein
MFMKNMLQGSIEPHSPLLEMPPSETRVYKIISVENFLRSLEGNYLHFTRLDRFEDERDGVQLPAERRTNEKTRFAKNPEFTIANSYDRARARTYAFCMALDSNDYIWKNYGNGDRNGKIGLEFDLCRLRNHLNEDFCNWTIAVGKWRCVQIFSLNYGSVRYVTLDEYRRGSQYLANPIEYAYLKDLSFAAESEFRITLSNHGIGHFGLADNSLLSFPDNLQIPFNFRKAFQENVITKLRVLEGSKIDFIKNEMSSLGIRAITV